MSRTRALEGLGRRLAAQQDELAGQTDLAGARARFLAAARRRRTPRWQRAALLASAVVAIAAAVVLWIGWGALDRATALSFEVAGAPAETGDWIAAPAGAPLEVRFSDGTRFALEPESRARIVAVDENGARVVIERGRARFEVEHRDKSRWQVDVGPYQVLVTGTSFEVGWDPVRERFELELAEGSVALSGPLVGGERAMHAGETARASVGEGRFEIAAGVGGALPPASSTAATPPAAPAETAAPSEPAPSTISTATPAGPSWRELAASGEYKRALEAARAAGFESLCEALPAGDLAKLADTARFAGDSRRAAHAYGALRRRFPGSGEAALAAFALGRIDFDQRGSFGGAAQWFATYLREQPGGPLAREAAGRLLEALERAGDSGGAQAAAQRYLDRYPDGPHAALARTVLAPAAATSAAP